MKDWIKDYKATKPFEKSEIFKVHIYASMMVNASQINRELGWQWQDWWRNLQI